LITLVGSLVTYCCRYVVVVVGCCFVVDCCVVIVVDWVVVVVVPVVVGVWLHTLHPVCLVHVVYVLLLRCFTLIPVAVTVVTVTFYLRIWMVERWLVIYVTICCFVTWLLLTVAVVVVTFGCCVYYCWCRCVLPRHCLRCYVDCLPNFRCFTCVVGYSIYVGAFPRYRLPVVVVTPFPVDYPVI